MEKKINFEDIKKANESIMTLDIKGKDYALVNERVKAFRMIYPQGTIQTEMLSNENGVCIFKASIFDGELLLANGTAYEKENSTFINKTSYIENCETSAIGRALGMCGFGIDTSIASAEEVQNAINNQNKEANNEIEEAKEHTKLIMKLDKLFTEHNVDYEKAMALYKVEDMQQMTNAKLENAIANIDKFEKVK